MIDYHYIMDDEKKNNSNGSRDAGPSKGSGGCASWVFAFIVAFIIFVLIESCGGGKKSSTYSTSSTSTRKECLAAGCTNSRVSGGLYCYSHTCEKNNCYNKRAEGSYYCYEHQPAANIGNQNKTNTKPSTKSTEKKKKTDPYGTADYSDYEDFYDDWYDEFDGIDDAEMYWEENH